MKQPTQSEIKELFFYCRETGNFTKQGIPNKVVGHMTKGGYIAISVRGRSWLAHRLAWLYVNGLFPLNDLDHIDGNRLNNRIGNLREATKSQNMQNRHRAHANNKAGLLGVRLHRDGKFEAQIQHKGKVKYLGLFTTPEEAHEAYVLAKRNTHEFCSI